MGRGLVGANLLSLVFTGRDGVIRTLDPLHPMQVRYQAALRPVAADYRRRPLSSGREQAADREEFLPDLRG